jgi:hypothetical protein
MQLDVDAGAGWRRIDLFAALDAAAEEGAHEEAHTWIKTVRGLRVDDEPFRSRFTYRGDSLWWFAELYLHKEQAILLAIRTIRAIDALIASARPQRLRVAGGRLAGVVSQAAAARGIPCTGPGWTHHRATVLRLDARAMSLAAAARLSRLRLASAPSARASIVAFVHRAFWRAGGVDGGAESYIGPILRALESRAGAIHYIGVGPRSNFRARRWWEPLTAAGEEGIVPIERYAPAKVMHESRALFRRRHEIRRRIEASPELRAHAVIDGVDCWPLVREQLAGIALLQFTWSARAMDEAAAALAALEPDVAVTYAEAGGWGRALALEARRIGVPLTGLQHGFIYRHWLNYRHEADEMRPDARNADDRGFPLPAKTLVFDEHAATHLRSAGAFPAQSVAVTGSARLDELITAVRQVTASVAAEVRERTGAGERPLIVFAAKEREARGSLPKLVAAVRALPELQLAIKPHPAETPEVYSAAVKGVPNIRVLDAGTPLPPLLGTAKGVVTVNSTVAIDALALGVPSLVVGLPNNLSPFVAAGSMLGASSEAEMREGLTKLLYDQEFRGRIERRRADGAADSAAASADAILALRSPRS